MDKPTNRTRNILFLIIFASLILRLLQISFAVANPNTYQPRADEAFYIQFGMNVAHGAFGMTHEFSFMDPLYGYLLGIPFLLFGRNLFTVYIIQAFIDTCSVFLTYLVGKEIGNQRIGLIAATAYSLTETAIFYVTTALKPTLVAFFVIAWIYFGLRLWRSNTRKGWLIYGLFLGLGVALRSNLFLLTIAGMIIVPLANFRTVKSDKKTLAFNVISGLSGLLLILFLLAYRNAFINGRWSFLPPNEGIVLHQVYNASNPRGKFGVPGFVDSMVPFDIMHAYKREAETQTGHPMSLYAVSTYWRGKALKYMYDNPTQTLDNIIRKLKEFTTYKEVGNDRSLSVGRMFSPILSFLPRPFGWLLAFGLPGIVLLTYRTPKGWLLLTATAVIVSTFVLFFAVSRFRFPIAPVLAVGAGTSVDMLLRWKQNSIRNIGILITSIAVLGSVSLWSSMSIADLRPAAFDANLIFGYVNMGNLEAAQKLSDTALKHTHNNYQIYAASAYLALAEGRPSRAVLLYREAISLKPRSHLLWFNYAIALNKSGKSADALEAIDTALRLHMEPEYLYRKALLLDSLGKHSDSRALLYQLTQRAQANKDNDWAHYAQMARKRLIGSD